MTARPPTARWPRSSASRIALVLSGVTSPADAGNLADGIRPAAVEPDLVTLVRTALVHDDDGSPHHPGSRHGAGTSRLGSN